MKKNLGSRCVKASIMLAVCNVLLQTSNAANADSFWRVQGSAASITIEMVEAIKPNIFTILLINFNHALGCEPEVGVALVEGPRYGTPQGQQWARSKMKITVDGTRTWSDRTGLTRYSNGMEAAFLAPDSLVRAISKGVVAYAQVTADTPVFEFPLEGAGAAIAEARKACRN